MTRPLADPSYFARAFIEAGGIAPPPQAFPRMVHVDSTAIEEAAYDPAQRHLTIRFIHGGRYTYLDVPPRVARADRGAVARALFPRSHPRPLHLSPLIGRAPRRRKSAGNRILGSAG
jgi:hypothetical protein